MCRNQIRSIETAIRIYYSKTVLTSNDVKALFKDIGESTVTKRKREARVKMKEKNVPIWDKSLVDTECAYEAWGLNINDLERRYNKLQKLGMLEDARTE